MGKYRVRGTVEEIRKYAFDCIVDADNEDEAMDIVRSDPASWADVEWDDGDDDLEVEVSE